MTDLAVRVGGLGRFPIGPPAFQESFSPVPTAVRGRGGDLDPAVWGYARFTPDGVDAYPAATLNHAQTAIIPVVRATFTGGTTVYPPNDTLYMDPSGAKTSRLMMAVRMQYYGQYDMKARRPFDFSSRTGVIGFDVDAVSDGITGAWVHLNVTEDPVPVHTFLIQSNFETGPIVKNAILIPFNDDSSPSGTVMVGTVCVYANYVLTQLTPTFTAIGSTKPLVNLGDLNRVEVRISTTSLEIWMSDYSTDDEVTFPNFHKIYAADLTLGWSRGYVHFGGDNHATEKFGFSPQHIYFWDNLFFDGPLLPAPRAYELPDNSVIGTVPPNLPDEPGFDYMRLAWEISDGSNKAQGIWDGNGTKVSPLTFAGSVNLSGATSAQMTLNLFALAQGAADTTWGLLYRFNGGTWRTRLFTAGDVTAINTTGSAGYLALVIDVALGDLTTGSNTIDLSSVNLPMSFPPTVMNVDLLVYT